MSLLFHKSRFVRERYFVFSCRWASQIAISLITLGEWATLSEGNIPLSSIIFIDCVPLMKDGVLEHCMRDGRFCRAYLSKKHLEDDRYTSGILAMYGG